MQVSNVETNPTDFNDWVALLTLLRAAFAGMEGRVDPPSSLSRLDVAGLHAKAQAEDLFVIRTAGDLVACGFGVPVADAYYLSKLAAAPQHQGQGHARRLIETAAARARGLGLSRLTLQTRVELVENHALFLALGFRQTGATAHQGHDRPTSLSFSRDLAV